MACFNGETLINELPIIAIVKNYETVYGDFSNGAMTITFGMIAHNIFQLENKKYLWSNYAMLKWMLIYER